MRIDIHCDLELQKTKQHAIPCILSWRSCVTPTAPWAGLEEQMLNAGPLLLRRAMQTRSRSRRQGLPRPEDPQGSVGLISAPDHMQQICDFLDVPAILRLGQTSKVHNRWRRYAYGGRGRLTTAMNS